MLPIKLSMNKMHKQIIDLLVSKSLQVASDLKFKLASGRMSNIYIDCKKTTFNSKGKKLIGNLIFDRISDLNIKAIGGLMLGAVPIADAVSQTSEDRGKPIDAFTVRVKPKEHGLEKTLEGDINPGDRVVIVDDVVTTGGSTIKAIEAAREFGLDIVKVIVLVDRQEGGRENIENTGVKFESIVTKEELIDAYNTGRDREGSLSGQSIKSNKTICC